MILIRSIVGSKHFKLVSMPSTIGIFDVFVRASIFSMQRAGMAACQGLHFESSWDPAGACRSEIRSTLSTSKHDPLTPAVSFLIAVIDFQHLHCWSNTGSAQLVPR